MPIYEFVCQACGNEFERIQSFSDTTVPGCPNCDSGNVRRQVGRPAIHFKGSGWYVTDSKNVSKSSGNGKKQADSSEAKPADSSAGSESQTPKTEKESTAV